MLCDGSTTGFNRSAGRARQPAAGGARHSVRAAPATSGPWFFPDAASQSCCPKGVPPSSPNGTPPFQFTAVPSRFVAPNRIKSSFFAPVHFAPAPARLDACPFVAHDVRRAACRGRRQEHGRQGPERRRLVGLAHGKPAMCEINKTVHANRSTKVLSRPQTGAPAGLAQASRRSADVSLA